MVKDASSELVKMDQSLDTGSENIDSAEMSMLGGLLLLTPLIPGDGSLKNWEPELLCTGLDCF